MKSKTAVALALTPMLALLSAALPLLAATTAVQSSVTATVAASSQCDGTTVKTAAADTSGYVDQALKMADDKSIGYSQKHRRLNPDVDCSSFVFYALKKAGYDVGDMPFSTATMDGVLTSLGFTAHDMNESELRSGDILWSGSHTEIYIGSNRTVGAHHDEHGGIDGLTGGDQTGEEVSQADLNAGQFSKYYRAGSSTTQTDDAPSADGANEIAMKLAQAFADAGYSKVATAGMLGNVGQESGGFDPKAGSPDGGYGLAQWTPSSKIRTWFDANGLSGTDISDADGQIKFLTATAESSFMDGTYIDEVRKEITVDGTLLNTWKNATDLDTAVIAWMAGWERPAWSSRHEETRKKIAKEYYDNYLGSISFDGAKSTPTGGCSTSAGVDSGDAEYGNAGGAPEGKGDFSWMCKGNQKICVASDAGVMYPHLEYGHQCVWYAWNRLGMIHGNEGWSYFTGNGGEIGATAQTRPGWSADTTPHPGDGISGYGSPFAGGGGYGHVAVVEEVKKDGSSWKIRISEGNADGSASFNSYQSRWLTQSEVSQAGCLFFRCDSWK